MVRLCQIVGCLLALLWAGYCYAEARPPIFLQIEGCDGEVENQALAMIDLELGEAPVADAKTKNVALASIHCYAAWAEIAVTHPDSGRSLSRVIEIEKMAPSLQPRTFALALTELISSCLTEYRRKVPPVVAPQATPVTPAQIKPPRPPLTRLRLIGFGGGQAFFSGTSLFGGGGIRVSRFHHYHLGWSADFLGQHGGQKLSLGEVGIDTLTVSASAVGYYAWQKVALFAGVGVRGGAVRLVGSTIGTGLQANTQWGAFVGPFGQVGVVVAPWRRLIVEAQFELGYDARSVEAIVVGNRQFAVEGVWLGFSAGVGLWL